MSRPPLHVCIATGQNLANLIPALQLQASHVVILETPEMRESAGNLKRALEARGIGVKHLPFDDTTPETIIRAAGKVALELGERPLVLNATGGHKLITLALVEQMEVADALHLVYAETRHDRLDWLKPVPEVEAMKDVLTLEDILHAQGYRLKGAGDRNPTMTGWQNAQWCVEAQGRESLTRQLGNEADKLARFFGALNLLADQALANEPDGPFRPQQEFEFAPGGANAKVLRDAQKIGLLHWEGDSEVVFRDEQAASYFRGGWLEEYVWLKLRGIKPRDWAVNVQVETVSGKTPNEFDALVAHRNRMLVIECKTSRFGRDSDRDAQYIYKLQHLTQRLGGIMAKPLLLSARKLSDPARNRARESNVDVIEAEQIRTFAQWLNRWMGNA